MNIVIIAGDPGGGRAIVPIIQKLLLTSNIQLFIYGYNEFPSVYCKAAIPHPITEISEPASIATARSILLRHKSDRLLAANSMNAVNWEHYFFSACQELKIASLSVLDFWGNYQYRYNLSQPDSLPDRIAVPDAKAQSDLIELGFPSTQIRITGQPALEAIAQKTLPNQINARHLLKKGSNKKIWIGFVSQPLSELYGKEKSTTDHPGYTEHDCIADLHQCVEEASIACDLFIRPHPREKLEKFQPYSTQQPFTINNETDQLQWIAAMDIIIGMNSIFLFEAALLNAYCVSYQPGMENKDYLPSNHAGLTHPVYRIDDLKNLLHKKIKQIGSSIYPANQLGFNQVPFSGSTQKIINILMQPYGTRNN